MAGEIKYVVTPHLA